MPKFGPNKGSENGEDMNAPKYHIKEKYCYKNFSIVFCVTAFNPEGFTTHRGLRFLFNSRMCQNKSN